jgi:hypothetical protein
MRSTVLIAVLAASASAAEFKTDFEGGRIGKVEQVGERHWRVGVIGETDQDGRNRQASWFYFRVNGAPRAELIIDLVDLPGEYNYRANKGPIDDKTPPVISHDGTNWHNIETVEYDAEEPRLRLHFTPRNDSFWLARRPPYTNAHLERLRQDVLAHPRAKEQVIGKTPQGRPILLWTTGSGPQTAWLMFRQHSWEAETSWTGEGAVRELLSNGDLRQGIQWKIIPFADPDGVARGGVRFNHLGYDLNRNWDAIDPVKTPEIAAQHNAVKDFLAGAGRIDFFLTLHNTETAEYLDGPPGGPSDPRIRALAERVFNALKERTAFAPSRPLSYASETTTAGMKGRMTVVQGLHRDFRIPAFLMEQRIAAHPKTGRLPNVQDRLAFGAALVREIAGAIRSTSARTP